MGIKDMIFKKKNADLYNIPIRGFSSSKNFKYKIRAEKTIIPDIEESKPKRWLYILLILLLLLISASVLSSLLVAMNNELEVENESLKSSTTTLVTVRTQTTPGPIFAKNTTVGK
ncbi:uncharacterized protein LOC134246948 [Saccostrea cucullata]|uniref:uncharacterized protein LOC134246948 n=1 Tax=Saccostrea cuccullata TaxID=36930 RepID=UPI002ED49740